MTRHPLIRTGVLYGISLAACVALLTLLRFKYLVHELAIEFYIGLIALGFTALGIWMGRRLVRRRQTDSTFVTNAPAQQTLGITTREMEVLQLLAAGHSNQEIAERLHLSLHTVKTHVSRLLSKLDAESRSQATARARSLRLVP